MLVLLLMSVASAAATGSYKYDPANDYSELFKMRTKGPIGVLTTSNGARVSYAHAESSLNKPLINNDYFMDTIGHLNRERIAERLVHAKGSGAFGYFEVTHSMSRVCKSSFLKRVGKKTPVAVRFSTVVGEKGSNDLAREVRGFSVKFYTEQGNFDIPGFNTPMYFYKDPLLFSTFVRALRRNPASHLFDPKTFWDIVTLAPEALHMFLIIYSDRGIPASYCHMPGFGIHTYQLVNDCGETHFCRWHMLPDEGIKSMSTKEARNISSTDLDYLTRDLFRTIGSGKVPTWSVKAQILTEKDVKMAKDKLGLDVFDVTKVLPLDIFPLQPVGKLYLNRNPKNFFAEVEQIALCPGNLVEGIVGAPDKVFESRRLAYRDAQLYRLGANFNKIPINCPFQTKTYTYNRDGVSPVQDNEGDAPNYYPNSYNGPVPYREKTEGSELIQIIEEKASNFDQAAELYSNELTTGERDRLIENLVESLLQVPKYLQDRAITTFTKIHLDLGKRIARSLNATACN